ncbi:Thioredoxin-like protein aaed1 [Gonapodya sp. JEL0774]|nr:Thioredoxin-like protein aaed1 [Gonapodya sp. JEL0774]
MSHQHNEKQFSDPSLFPFENVANLSVVDTTADTDTSVAFHQLYVRDDGTRTILASRLCIVSTSPVPVVAHHRRGFAELNRDGQYFENRDYFVDLNRVDKLVLAERKVRIVLITPAPAWAVRRFIKETRLSLPMYSNPTRSLYTALNMNFRFDSKLEYRVASPHVRTTVPAAWIKGFAMGVAGGGTQGDPRQQGGAFVLGPGLRECSFVHFDRFNADHATVPTLLEAAGIADWKEAGAFRFWDEMTEQEKAKAERRDSVAT